MWTTCQVLFEKQLSVQLDFQSKIKDNKNQTIDFDETD